MTGMPDSRVLAAGVERNPLLCGKRNGFGIVGRERPGLDTLAPQVEALGYDELWTNDWSADSRDSLALRLLASWSATTAHIALGVGVIPLSDRTPASIADEVVRLGLPLDRLILGVGSGTSGSLALVRDGVRDLRARLPGVVIAVAALGPRMRALAGEIADIVLPNWLVAGAVPAFRNDVAAGSARLHRPVPRIAAYVRVAIGPTAELRLRDETERHRRNSPPVDAHVRSQAVEPATLGVAAQSPEDVGRQLAAYREALDTCIVRGLPAGDDVESWLEVAVWAAPAREERQ